MVERYSMSIQGPFDRDPPSLEPDNEGDWVRHSDYARLQEQVETLTRERDEALRGNRFAQLERLAISRAETAEAEQAKLLALLEGRDNFIVERGLWPDFVEALPVALQKEPLSAQERDDGR